MKLSTHLLTISSLLIAFTLIAAKCSNSTTTPNSSLYVDIQHERGVWGCGIPCTGVMPPRDEVCILPNGICNLAEVMPVTYSSPSKNRYKLSYTEKGKLKFEWKGKLIDSSESLKKYLSRLDGDDYNTNFKRIRQYIDSHFYVPKNLAFAEKDLEKIIKLTGTRFSKLVVKKGEYKIETINGLNFFELDIVLQ